MMRSWTQSVARARTYAAPKRSRRAMARAVLRFEWLRRRAARAKARIVLNARFRMALDLRFHGGIRLRNTGRDGMPGVPGKTSMMYLASRETWLRTHIASAAQTPQPRSQQVIERALRVRIEKTLVDARSWQTRLLTRLIPAVARRDRHRPNAGSTKAAPERESRVERAIRTPNTSHALRNGAGEAPLVSRVSTRHSQMVTQRLALRIARATRTRVGISPAANGPHSVPAMKPLSFAVVERRERVINSVAARAFAPQPQPLASTQRPAVPESVPVEHIEQRLRESISVVTERTVKRELERTLRPGAVMNRRLRESIQSEMYDDIVFERERRGDR